jgi:hypothetical protein
MSLLDSMPTSAPVRTAKRPPRARRAEAPPGQMRRKFSHFRAGRDLRMETGGRRPRPHRLRGGADSAQPAFAGCLRQRLALRAANLARRCPGCAKTRPLYATPSVWAEAARPLRPGGCISCLSSMRRCRRASTRRSRARRRCSDCRRRLTPALSSPLSSPRPILLKFYGPTTDAKTLAFVVADLALATRLGWARPVPLLAVAIGHPSLWRGAGGNGRDRRKRTGPTQSLMPMGLPSSRPMRSPAHQHYGQSAHAASIRPVRGGRRRALTDGRDAFMICGLCAASAPPVSTFLILPRGCAGASGWGAPIAWVTTQRSKSSRSGSCAICPDLAHSASFHALEKIAPSNPRIKQLAWQRRDCAGELPTLSDANFAA